MAIAIFFVAHWQLSVFFQTFFLHRYGAHRMYTMSKGWERFFYLCTYLTQGPSFLSPRGYAILHRMHHAFSDTPKDPHSPTELTNGPVGLWSMMLATKKKYDDFAYDRVQARGALRRRVAELASARSHRPVVGRPHRLGRCVHALLLQVRDRTRGCTRSCPSSTSWARCTARSSTGAATSTATRTSTTATSRATRSIFDFVTAGELFQNNHHKYGMSPNFAARWFELDPTYQVMRVFNFLGIIDMSGAQVARPPVKAAPRIAA